MLPMGQIGPSRDSGRVVSKVLQAVLDLDDEGPLADGEWCDTVPGWLDTLGVIEVLNLFQEQGGAVHADELTGLLTNVWFDVVAFPCSHVDPIWPTYGASVTVGAHALGKVEVKTLAGVGVMCSGYRRDNPWVDFGLICESLREDSKAAFARGVQRIVERGGALVLALMRAQIKLDLRAAAREFDTKASAAVRELSAVTAGEAFNEYNTEMRPIYDSLPAWAKNPRFQRDVELGKCLGGQ